MQASANAEWREVDRHMMSASKRFERHGLFNINLLLMQAHSSLSVVQCTRKVGPSRRTFSQWRRHDFAILHRELHRECQAASIMSSLSSRRFVPSPINSKRIAGDRPETRQCTFAVRGRAHEVNRSRRISIEKNGIACVKIACVDDTIPVSHEEWEIDGKARVILVQPTHTTWTIRCAREHAFRRICREGRANDSQRVGHQWQEGRASGLPTNSGLLE